jgi:hypothetical protein
MRVDCKWAASMLISINIYPLYTESAGPLPCCCFRPARNWGDSKVTSPQARSLSGFGRMRGKGRAQKTEVRDQTSAAFA